MHCITFRPSARFFQSLVSPSSTSEEDDSSRADMHEGIKVVSRSAISFFSKEERVAHVEQSKSILLNVSISSEVMCFLGTNSREDLNVMMSIPIACNASQVVTTIFDHFLQLRRRSERTHLDPRLMYMQLTKGMFPKLSNETVALSLLQHDLTIAICDAGGNAVKQLKRFFKPKLPQPTPMPELPENVPTVSQLANYFLQHCCHTTGVVASQKSLLSILTSFVPEQHIVNQGVTIEAQFQPPFCIKLVISDERRAMRKLMFQEILLREKISEEAFHFFTSYATPYFDILTCDHAMRNDWIAYQSFCRHKLHLSEISSRIGCERSIVLNNEVADRNATIAFEFQQRRSTLQKAHEMLMFFGCTEASRTEIVWNAERVARLLIVKQFTKEALHVEGLIRVKEEIEAFLVEGSLLMEENTRRCMLSLYHDCVVQLSVQ